MDFEEIIQDLNENGINIENEVNNKKELINYIKEYLIDNNVYDEDDIKDIQENELIETFIEEYEQETSEDIMDTMFPNGRDTEAEDEDFV